MKLRNKFFDLVLVVALLAPALACQTLGGTPTLTPSGGASAPVVGVKVVTPTVRSPTPAAAVPAAASPTVPGAASAPILGGGAQTPGAPAASAPILGASAGVGLFQPVTAPAQPVRVAQVLQALMVSDSNYGTVVVVENPNPEVAIEDTLCQITSYGPDGAVLGTDSLRIGLLFPGERRILYAGLMATPGAAQPAKLGFAVSTPGHPVKTSLTADSLTTSQVKYWPDAGLVGALVKNNSPVLVTQPQVTALLYDSQGQVIGVGADAFSGFVLPGKSVGVLLRLPAGLKPARVEFDAALQGEWTVQALSSGRPALSVAQAQGFRDPQRDLGEAVFVAVNSSSDRSLNALQAEATAFDAAGDVIASVLGQTPVVFPGEQVAATLGPFSAVPGAAIASTTVDVSPAATDNDVLDYRALGLDQNPLSVDAQYIAQNFAQVSAVVKNAWKNPVDSAAVTVVEWDAAGRIVGFGSTGVGPVPAGGQVQARLTMVVAERAVPVRLTGYASASNGPAIR